MSRQNVVRAAVLASATLTSFGVQAAPDGPDRPSIALDGVMDVSLRQAAFWRGQGNATQSEHALRRALTIDPRNADALAALVVLEAEAGRLEAARNSLAQLAAAAPDDSRATALGVLVRTGPPDPQALAEGDDRLAQQVRSNPEELHGQLANALTTGDLTGIRVAEPVDTGSRPEAPPAFQPPAFQPPAFQPFVRAGGSRPMPRAIDPPSTRFPASPFRAASAIAPSPVQLAQD